MRHGRFHGSMVALITPFFNGQIDVEGLSRLVHIQAACSTNAIIVCGTTGEGLSLTLEEQATVIKTCVKAAKDTVSIYKAPLDGVAVIAGVAGICLENVLEQARQAERLGAEALLVLTPYYVKPTPKGLFDYFAAIHNAVNIPLILYNNPGRSAFDVTLPILKQISTLPRLIGIKDATGDLSRPTEIRNALGNGFLQFSGDDATALAYRSVGGHGCISVTANVAPLLCSSLHRAATDGDFELASEIQDTLMPLHSALFMETNPIPVKWAAQLLNFCSAEVRPPLTQLSQAHHAELAKIVAKVLHDPEKDEFNTDRYLRDNYPKFPLEKGFKRYYYGE